MTSMRKHVVIVSEESVLSGHYHCGIGEVVDTMADTLRDYYDVTIITPGTHAGGHVRSTITLGVDGDEFIRQAALVINDIKPDLVHNFAAPELIGQINIPCRKILTFDQWEASGISEHLEDAAKYDAVTTVSPSYAKEVMAAYPEAADLQVVGILNGISSYYYDGGDNCFTGLSDKMKARAYYYRTICREDTGKVLIVMMARLVPEKGIQDVIDAAEDIYSGGVELVVYGRGDAVYEEQLKTSSDAGKIVYHKRMADYSEMCAAMRAADFYLMPSISEACGLQPMKAAKLGCVPIVRPVGGLVDNFTADNAILITGTLTEAVWSAAALSDTEYTKLRKAGMNGKWTWTDRIAPWVELYGLTTEPRPVTPPSSDHGGETASNYAAEESYRLCPFARTEETTNE